MCVCLYIIWSQHMVENIFWKIYIKYRNSWPFADRTDITWTHKNNIHKSKKKRIISIKLFYKNRSILSNNIFCFSFNLNSFKLKTISTSNATNNNNKNNSINNRKKQSISLRFNLIKYKINFASCSYISCWMVYFTSKTV